MHPDLDPLYPNPAMDPDPTGPPHPLIAALRLERHPEGGWYRETWRASVELAAHGGTRAVATSISFLLLPGERSRWHRVRSDEMWFWQGGGRLRLSLGGSAATPAEATGASSESAYSATYVLGPNPVTPAGSSVEPVTPAGSSEDLVTYVLGPAPVAGDLVQCLVPGGVWQAAEPVGADYVLVGCVVAPGFDFADFELAP
jgi:predicted cupin superfamily sugar epimerase